jgi:hypothetical protein
MTPSFRPRLSTLAVATTILLVGVAPGAGAVALNNGFTSEPFLDTALPGTTSAMRHELAGTVEQDQLTSFSFGTLSGHVQNRVVRETGTGTLDFYWRVVLDPSSTGVGVSALRLIDFGYSSLTDADWRIDGLGSTAPTTGRLFNPGTYPGGAINFLFRSPVDGDSDGSMFFFLHTDATHYAETASYDLLGGANLELSGLFKTFAPAAAVPEPTPASVLALGLLTLGWLRSRRARHDA